MIVLKREIKFPEVILTKSEKKEKKNRFTRFNLSIHKLAFEMGLNRNIE